MTNNDSDIIPVLVYSDIRAAHDFLVETLGFTSGGLHEEPDGQVTHGEVQLSGRRVWLHRVARDHGLDTPAVTGLTGGGMVVHVPDVDAHFARAKAAGADILGAPEDQDYGQREYGVRDPEGHSWWIATPLTSASEV